METFFVARRYPNDLNRGGRERASTKSIKGWNFEELARNITNDRAPYVTTFHPSNLIAEKIISRNFRILREDSMTRNIFNKPPPKAFRRAKNLKDLLVRSSLTRNPPQQSQGTFLCNRPVCRRSPHVNSSSIVTAPKTASQDIFPASRNTWFIAYRAPNVHRQCILGRLDAG